MLYLLNHETFISVLGIQDRIFLVWLLDLVFFSTSTKRNFQPKEVKRLIFATEKRFSSMVVNPSVWRERVNRGCLFDWVCPELHTTLKCMCSVITWVPPQLRAWMHTPESQQHFGVWSPPCCGREWALWPLRHQPRCWHVTDHSGHAVAHAGPCSWLCWYHFWKIISDMSTTQSTVQRAVGRDEPCESTWHRQCCQSVLVHGHEQMLQTLTTELLSTGGYVPFGFPLWNSAQAAAKSSEGGQWCHLNNA